MRLICPNCGAQYEVPDDVIPEGGRDVQCSNCGDTWFQKDPSQDRELSEELEQSLDEAHWENDAVAPASTPASDYSEPDPATAAPHTGHEERVEPEDEGTQWEGFDDPEFDGHDDEGADKSEPADLQPEPTPAEYAEYEDPESIPRPRKLDPEVSEILRQEAEHESQARRADVAGGLETQPDLGLEEPQNSESQQDREARLRMARMRGLSEEQALGAAAGLAANASRRDLLPDIEEINSSLRKDSNRAAADDYSYETDPAEPRQSGFSRGFLIMILIAVALVLLYTYAAQISEMVPALGGVMDSYVGAVNGLRVWLDTQILSLMGWLDGMTSQTPADS